MTSGDEGHDPHAPVVPLRIGEFMLAKGHIEPEQLDAALRRQFELQQAGTRMLLGEVLVEMGKVNPKHIEEALAYQRLSKRPEG